MQGKKRGGQNAHLSHFTMNILCFDVLETPIWMPHYFAAHRCGEVCHNFVSYVALTVIDSAYQFSELRPVIWFVVRYYVSVLPKKAVNQQVCTVWQ